MRYDIILSQEAIEDLRRLTARERSAAREGEVQVLAVLSKPMVETWLKESGKPL